MAPTHLLLAALAASASALILPGTEKFARTVANLDITNRGYVRVDSEAPTVEHPRAAPVLEARALRKALDGALEDASWTLSLIHISEPTRPY